MPSPFPGMDPFIEGQKWKGFHHSLLSVIRDALVPLVIPKYVVDVEEYVYLVGDEHEGAVLLEPDVAIAERGERWRQPAASSAQATLQPVAYTLPQTKRVRQAYLVIENRQRENIVTVIELLSPWNKASGVGRNEYLNKRENVLASPCNLVELDLLRGGARLPTVEPLAPADYCAFVCRSAQFPRADVFAWSLLDILPTIPVPLMEEDADVMLDLQQAFDLVYERAGYQYSLDYGSELTPRLNDQQHVAVQAILRQKGGEA